MNRTPEPELMDEPRQARAYALADFDEPNARFLNLFDALAGSAAGSGRVADLGCGPADIAMRLLERWPNCTVDAVDGSPEMIRQAAERLTPALSERLRLVEAALPSDRLQDGVYDYVISNSLLHHLHDPSVLWDTVKRVAKDDARGLVVDLIRPPSVDRAKEIVTLYAAEEHPILQRDFYNSLLAAFEVDEVRLQLTTAGLDHLQVSVISDRHLAVSGVMTPSSQPCSTTRS